MPTLAHIAVHPVKALDPVDLERVGFTDIGGLDGDRAYAIAVHPIRADTDLDGRQIALDAPGQTTSEFHLDDDRDDIEAWLSAYFGERVTVESGRGGSLTDGVVYGETDQTGPTLTSAATLREVASWYDGIDAREMRLRLRPNLVVEGVPPFWEDRLVDGGVRVGDVRLEVTHPVPRCVVPTRDPHTGESDDGFRETFIERRRETLPAWADRDAFDTLFSVTVGTRVPDGQRDGELRVGSAVQTL